MNWGDFYQMVGLDVPPKKERVKATAEVALTKAKEIGLNDWVYNSSDKNFQQTTPKQP